MHKGYDSKILGGNGESAVTYIHIQDLIELLLTVIHKSHSLPGFDVYIASCENASSHRELFDIATKTFFGHKVKPILIPKFIAFFGILLRISLWKIGLTEQPFEKPWMLQYLDLKPDVDNSYTRTVLDWSPTPRLHIRRRLLFVLSKMKSNPHEWNLKNEAALRRAPYRPNFIVSEHLMVERERILAIIFSAILSPKMSDSMMNYQRMDYSILESAISSFYNALVLTIRRSDKSIMV